MSSQGRSVDLVRQVVGSVLNVFGKKTTVCIAPCDGWVLKMHYQWTFWMFLGGFSAIWYSWFHRDVITCVSHFNAEAQVRMDYMNICLSYPYVEEDGEKRFLLFYRWVHFVFLTLALVYYIPRKLSKNYENPKVKKLFEDLATNVHRYDQMEKDLMEKTSRYVVYNQQTHNGLYVKYLNCNIIALFIDICCFFFLDFVFQGRFRNYGFNAYPFYRDPVNFTDPMSTAFPPFAKCSIHEVHQLMDKRQEEFGCHLTVMELYEKIFLLVWYWLLTLIVITVFYIFFVISMNTSFIRMYILRISKPVSAKSSVRNVVVKAINYCKIGDIYLLYRLRQFFSHSSFYELLLNLSDEKYLENVIQGVNINHKGGSQMSQNRQNQPLSQKQKAAMMQQAQMKRVNYM